MNRNFLFHFFLFKITLTGNALISGSLCFDRKFDCDREICRDFPFTAREECAKTCGFCSVDSSISSPSSDTTLRSMSPSVQIDGRSGGTSHRPAKHESYEATQNIPAYSRLSRGFMLRLLLSL